MREAEAEREREEGWRRRGEKDPDVELAILRILSGAGKSVSTKRSDFAREELKRGREKEGNENVNGNMTL